MGSVLVYKNGVFVSPKRMLNFVEGTNMTITVTDDETTHKTDIQFDAAGGAGSAGAVTRVTFAGNVA